MTESRIRGPFCWRDEGTGAEAEDSLPRLFYTFFTVYCKSNGTHKKVCIARRYQMRTEANSGDKVLVLNDAGFPMQGKVLVGWPTRK
jgi:hypothetical protein